MSPLWRLVHRLVTYIHLLHMVCLPLPMQLKPWVQWCSLLPRPTRKIDPAVECSSTAFTAATWFEANSIGGSLDDVAEADLLVGNETWETHLKPWALALLRQIV